MVKIIKEEDPPLVRITNSNVKSMVRPIIQPCIAIIGKIFSINLHSQMYLSFLDLRKGDNQSWNGNNQSWNGNNQVWNGGQSSAAYAPIVIQPASVPNQRSNPPGKFQKCSTIIWVIYFSVTKSTYGSF